VLGTLSSLVSSHTLAISLAPYPCQPSHIARPPPAKASSGSLLFSRIEQSTQHGTHLRVRRYAGTDKDAPREADGSLYGGWHWNMPYTIKRDLPDWYSKELSRFTGDS